MGIIRTLKYRIIPFLLSGISGSEILDRYPISSPINFTALPSCEKIVSLLKSDIHDDMTLRDSSHSKPIIITFNREYYIRSELSVVYSSLNDYSNVECRKLCISKVRSPSMDNLIYLFPGW